MVIIERSSSGAISEGIFPHKKKMSPIITAITGITHTRWRKTKSNERE